MIAPLAKTGVISPELNLWLAVPIGFVFGFALFHAGFTDGRRIARGDEFENVGALERIDPLLAQKADRIELRDRRKAVFLGEAPGHAKLAPCEALLADRIDFGGL